MPYQMCILAIALLASAAFFGSVPPAFAAPRVGQADVVKTDDAKPVQVYILMGHSNMLGEGIVQGGKNGTLEFAVKAGICDLGLSYGALLRKSVDFGTQIIKRQTCAPPGEAQASSKSRKSHCEN